MKSIAEILCEKEAQLKKLTEEADALRVAARIVSEAGQDTRPPMAESKPQPPAAAVSVDSSRRRSWP